MPENDMPLRRTQHFKERYYSFSTGITCIASGESDEDLAPRYFASRRADSPHYDPVLAELSANLQRLLRDAHEARTDEKSKIGLLVTSHGLLPVWKFEFTGSELPEGLVDESAVLLDEKSDAEVAALLGLDTSHGVDYGTALNAAGRRPVYFLGEPTGDGGVNCSEPGHTCQVEVSTPFASGAPRYFASQRRDAPNYDAVLGELSAKLNAQVEQSYLARKDSNARVGLLLTHRGLLPVWKGAATSAQSLAQGERTLEDMSDEEVTAVLHLA